MDTSEAVPAVTTVRCSCTHVSISSCDGSRPDSRGAKMAAGLCCVLLLLLLPVDVDAEPEEDDDEEAEVDDDIAPIGSCSLRFYSTRARVSFP